MAVDPTTIIGEILGQPAADVSNPVSLDYQCPFVNSACIKRSHRTEGPYPVCSIFKRSRRDADPGLDDLIVVCPKRFFEVDLLGDVIKHCWGEPPPKSPRIAHEVTMEGFGSVDMVVADIDPKTLAIDRFMSVEIQAVDITGSVEPAYYAHITGTALTTRPTWGFNWANVRKRFMTQLVTKGFFHHHWGTKIIAVLQDHVYARMRRDIEFPEVSVDQSNILFMLYKYDQVEDEEGTFRPTLVLDRVTGTTHNALMTGILYRQAPDRDEFCRRILNQIR